MFRLFLKNYGGGGHITLAGAQVEGMSIYDVKQELIEKIIAHLPNYEDNMFKSAESVYEELGIKDEPMSKDEFAELMSTYALNGYFRYHQDNFSSGYCKNPAGGVVAMPPDQNPNRS